MCNTKVMASEHPSIEPRRTRPEEITRSRSGPEQTESLGNLVIRRTFALGSIESSRDGKINVPVLRLPSRARGTGLFPR